MNNVISHYSLYTVKGIPAIPKQIIYNTWDIYEVKYKKYSTLAHKNKNT